MAVAMVVSMQMLKASSPELQTADKRGCIRVLSHKPGALHPSEQGITVVGVVLLIDAQAFQKASLAGLAWPNDDPITLIKSFEQRTEAESLIRAQVSCDQRFEQRIAEYEAGARPFARRDQANCTAK